MTTGETPRGGRRVGWLVAMVLGTAAVTLAVERALSHHGDDHAHGHDDEHAEHGEKDAHEGHDHEGHGHEAEGHELIKLTDEAKKNAGIVVGTAGEHKLASTLDLSGEVVLNADLLAHVTPRVSGTVREVKKQLGDAVKAGDVLAILESRELSEISREARASGERLKLAEANFARIDKLVTDGIVAEKDLLVAKQALAEAKIERESASQAAAATGASGAFYRLLAPLDGTVIEKHIAIGEVLKDDTRAFVVADLTKLWVDVTVYSKDLARVNVGQAVMVKTDGIAEAAFGKISFLSATASGEARTTHARVVLDNPGGSWRPGLFVNARVGVDEAVVPVAVIEEAVQTVEGKSVVFVEEDGGFEARPVITGRTGLDAGGDREIVEVTSGLTAGDRYVEKGAFTLKAELGKGEAHHDH